jgi:hypothetical protein
MLAHAALGLARTPHALQEGMRMSRMTLAILSCACIAIPFLMVTFPPITDLSQQTAQIRLFLETVADPAHSPYRIQWFTPYGLSYLVIGGAWALFGPLHAGRIAMLIICLLWAAAIHLTAYSRGRSAASATLASLFVFNHVVYWGFYSFALGWPAFLLWLHVTMDKEPANRPNSLRTLENVGADRGFSAVDALMWMGTALLLYLSHVLWLVAGLLWFVVHSLVFRKPLQTMLLRALSLAPVVVLVAVWYPRLTQSTMDTPALWGSNPITRLSFSWLTDAALGGLRGPAEGVVLALALGWLVLSLVQHRRTIREETDLELLLSAAFLFVLVLVLPDKYMNTIRFEHRWLPPAVILLLLAVPPPMVRPMVRRAVAVIVLVAFCLTTSLVWSRFERIELAGLKESLNALPENPRVLGLSMIPDSEFIEGKPFVQTFAYAQVMKGGGLNFTFAEFPSCLVVYKKPTRPPWTVGLEWFPERVKESDLAYFDFALINGDEQVHGITGSNPGLQPVTREGRWRLYRVVPGRTRN